MKRILFTVLGSILLYSGSIASGNASKKSSALAVLKPATAQCNFAFFRGHRQGSGAALQWGMDAPGATKFVVSRTYDFDPYDPYAVWEEVSVVNGDNSRMYSISDKTVFPGIIHYKVEAVMADGTTVCSDLKEIRIIKKN
ncbi:MAG: hypothetical protein ACM3H8_08815 [Sphingobacteriales bacterium]